MVAPVVLFALVLVTAVVAVRCMGVIDRWKRNPVTCEDKAAADATPWSPPQEQGGKMPEQEVSVDPVHPIGTDKNSGQDYAVMSSGSNAVSVDVHTEPAMPENTNPHGAQAVSRDTDFESSIITFSSSTTDRKPCEADSRNEDICNEGQGVSNRESQDAVHLPEHRDGVPQRLALPTGGLQYGETPDMQSSARIDSALNEEAARRSSTAHGESPLIIQADASLVDGLRALLVHHLKRSVGANTVNLSASQAELLEHHLARLASYAQKIVHTLAFATRFLSKHHFEGDHGELESPHTDGGRGHGAGNPGFVDASNAQPSPVEVARPPRKSLKLNDDEILSLYRSAQMEAAIEADWRGIQGPTPSRNSLVDGGGTSRSAASTNLTASDGMTELKDADQEYLRMLSRALQQPGRSPRAFTAELMDPSKDSICCRPGVPTVLNVNGVMGGNGKADVLHSPVAAPAVTGA